MSDFEKYMKYKKKYLQLRSGTNNFSGGGGGASDKLDEVYFWGTQILEHFKIFYLATTPDEFLDVKGLDPNIKDIASMLTESKRLSAEFKQKAATIFQAWKNILDSLFVNNGIELKKINLTADQIKIVNSKYPNALNNIILLTEESIAYKQKYYETQQKGYWLGWLVPAFANHTKEEAEYLLKKLTDKPMSKEEEIAFFNKNVEDLELSKKFINPTQKYEIGKAKELIEIGNKPLDLLDSIKYNKDLQQFYDSSLPKLKTGQLLSAINAELACHNERETRRAQYVLSKFK